MKFALVVCFAALVACEPEAKPEAAAEPWLAYAYGGYRAYGYGAYAHPYAHHGYYGKRSAEAEPEADPALLYGAYSYPYAYSGLYNGYAGYHAGYPYAHAYAYGKRSADAEPKAEAEADAYYGYYGYGARPYYAGYHAGYPYTYAGYRGYHWG